MRIAKRAVFWSVGLLVIVPAWAQTSDAPRPDGPPGRGRARAVDRMGWLTRVLARRLDLDAEQQAQYDAIVEKFRQQFVGDDENSPRTLFEQMRAAREAGDRERFEQLRERLHDLRAQMAEQIEPFFDEVEQILRDDQIPILNEFREQVESRVRGQRQMQVLRRAMRELRGRLDLTAEQAERYQELTGTIRDQMLGQHQRGEQMRELVNQMRQARAAGDEERLAELREQMRSLRPDPQHLLDAFFSGLERFLTPAQLKAVEAYREETLADADTRADRELDVRRVLRAARRLRLTGEKRQQLREIEREAMREVRKLRRRDREGQALLAEKIADEIRDLLTPEQVEKFDQLLERQSGLRRRARSRGHHPDTP